MAIKAPHFLDVMRGGKAESGATVLWPSQKYRDEFSHQYTVADKFEFGDLGHFMVSPEVFVFPLTPEEHQFWADGLIPLPNPEATYFEYRLDGWNIGYLVRSTPHWEVTRIDWGKSPDNGMFHYFASGTWVRILDSKDWAQGGEPLCEYGGDSSFRGRIERLEGDRYRRGLKADIKATIYLALMLNSKSTDIDKMAAPVKLNKARIKSGREPFPEHYIVTIAPTRFRQDGDTTGTHASPRLHWRRSHLRELRDAEGKVHKKVIIPRHLVGKRELGEVTHEYRVKVGI